MLERAAAAARHDAARVALQHMLSARAAAAEATALRAARDVAAAEVADARLPRPRPRVPRSRARSMRRVAAAAAADAARLHQKVAESAAETDAARLRSRVRAAPRRRPRPRLQRSSRPHVSRPRGSAARGRAAQGDESGCRRARTPALRRFLRHARSRWCARRRGGGRGDGSGGRGVSRGDVGRTDRHLPSPLRVTAAMSAAAPRRVAAVHVRKLRWRGAEGTRRCLRHSEEVTFTVTRVKDLAEGPGGAFATNRKSLSPFCAPRVRSWPSAAW